MSSRTKNLRRRVVADDDTPNGTVPPSTKTPHHQAPKKLLSFAQDNDEDDSCSSRLNKIKPSSSHIHTSSNDHPLPHPSNVQPLSGTYTPEALLELRKNTKTLVPSSSHHRFPPSKPVILLKQADELDPDDDREEEATTAQLAGIGLGKSIQDQDDKRDPSQEGAAAAAAVAGCHAGFYILGRGSNHGEAEGLSDEEPEFRGRIGFFGDKIEKKGVFDNDDGVGERVVAMEGVGFRKEDDEEEEEDKIWEEEQFRKGLGKRMNDASSSGGSVVGTSSNSVALPIASCSSEHYSATKVRLRSHSSFVSFGPEHWRSGRWIARIRSDVDTAAG